MNDISQAGSKGRAHTGLLKAMTDSAKAVEATQ